MKYKSIEEEAKLCRKAFKGSKIGDVVWFCHHGVPIEILTEPAENRIDFILKCKHESERAIRLHWFRPCEIKPPADLNKACADWDKALVNGNCKMKKLDSNEEIMKVSIGLYVLFIFIYLYIKI